MFFKITFLKSCKFHRKAPASESLIKLQALRSATLLKRDSKTGFFLWNLQNRASWVAVSDSFKFPICNFIKIETPAIMFFCEFCILFKNISWQNTSGWLLFIVYLWIFRSFSDHLFYGAPLRNWLFHVKVTEFQPPDNVKNYFTNVFQAFYKGPRSSHSKVFSLLKIPENYTWRS